ncbi:MAG TPA: glycosyltransferase family 4 protein [Pirellulales bacterium]|nr:glycosyltransferase family 4 protein [Pirellulales bacterium]
MNSPLALQHEPIESCRRPCDAHVVLLTNFIPPHALPVYTALAERVRKLTVLISTPMESNRQWLPEWGTLDVRVQRTLTVQRPWKHRVGFRDKLSVHIPWNTIGLLRKLRPDVVISGEMGARSLLSACYAALTPSTRLIVYATLSEHTEQSRGWLRYLLRRVLARHVHTFAANGASGTRYLTRTLGVDPSRICHVPYTIVPDLFDRGSVSRPSRLAHRLVFAGQFIERKGLLPFVEALALWAADHPDRMVEFDLIGSGPLQAKLEATSRPANLRLRFLGQCEYGELPARYQEAGIFVFPTLADEWGMVVNEALSAGLPVLGSLYSQAVEELCLEGETGWRFRPDRPREIYDAIERALDTPAERLEQMRRRGRQCVERLTPEYVADAFLAAIQTSLPTQDVV